MNRMRRGVGMVCHCQELLFETAVWKIAYSCHLRCPRKSAGRMFLGTLGSILWPLFRVDDFLLTRNNLFPRADSLLQGSWHKEDGCRKNTKAECQLIPGRTCSANTGNIPNQLDRSVNTLKAKRMRSKHNSGSPVDVIPGQAAPPFPRWRCAPCGRRVGAGVSSGHFTKDPQRLLLPR